MTSPETPRVYGLGTASGGIGPEEDRSRATRLMVLLAAALLVALIGVGIAALATSGGSSMTISARFATAQASIRATRSTFSACRWGRSPRSCPARAM